MPSDENDAAAISELQAVLKEQKTAFLKNQFPSYDERVSRLNALIGMMLSHKDAIREALVADFGSHPQGASDVIECLGPVGRASYAIQNLKDWMQDDHREVDPQFYGNAKAFVRMSPKGVIGNIVPWNFPFDLSMGPASEMLAAGNRVIIKPSEFTPACGKLMQEMVAKTFPRDLVHVVLGGVALSQQFSRTPFDHMLYTGSTHVGRQVMRECAANLTPVTLELGGKCPAILTPGAVTDRNVSNIVSLKMAKNGQVCISVDHVFVHRDEEASFVELAQKFVRSTVPDYSKTSDCAGIISLKHLDRLEGLLDDAKSSGSHIVPLEERGAVDRTSRRMPLQLVLKPTLTSKVLTEEIFGPILPIVTYSDLQEAIDQINTGDRPLGLNVYGSDEKVIRHVLDNTSSGGASVNCAAVAGALNSMGFGGVGASGHGRHHGKQGFLEFSNPRGVFERGDQNDLLAAFGPPYSFAVSIAEAAFKAAGVA